MQEPMIPPQNNDLTTEATASAESIIDWGKELVRHENWLRTVIAARVGEAQAVSDVFQEVALAAVRQVQPLRDPSKIAPWLYRLAVNQSLLYRRSAGRRRKKIERYQETAPQVLEQEAPLDPLGWLLADERRKLVAKALEELPDEPRELLLLKYIHDWNYKEMAEKLGLTVSAVQARLHRARALLRAILTKNTDLGEQDNNAFPYPGMTTKTSEM